MKPFVNQAMPVWVHATVMAAVRHSLKEARHFGGVFEGLAVGCGEFGFVRSGIDRTRILSVLTAPGRSASPRMEVALCQGAPNGAVCPDGRLRQASSQSVLVGDLMWKVKSVRAERRLVSSMVRGVS